MRNTRFALKNHLKETRLFKSRAIAALLLVLIFSAVLIIRLTYLQFKDYRFYSTLSRHNLLNIIPITPNRGLIYDRYGVLLAKDIPTYTLAVIPKGIKNLHYTIDQLSKIITLTPEQIRQFYKVLHQYRAFQPVPLKFKLSDEEVARFYVDQFRFPGVQIQSRMMRYYPLGNIMSDVLGYVGRINPHELQQVNTDNYSIDDDIGKMGIEKYYEKELHGTMGADEAEIDASGHIVRILKETPPKTGDTLYLTIDSHLQAEAEKALGDESGAIVVIQPQTGAILALVSEPAYDPNPFVSGLRQEDFQNLLNSPLRPLYNRAIRGQFNAASTIKPFFALGGLDDGVVSPKYRVFDPGWFQLPNTQHIFHDWKPEGHGWADVTKAIIVSCDIYFFNLAVNMGINRIDEILHNFGFGEFTGIDMPEEVRGLVPTPKWKMHAHGHAWYTGDTVVLGIGQGFLLVTPLQLAQAVATIANRGQRFKPHLLLKTMHPDNSVVDYTPVGKEPFILQNPKNWDIVIHAMEGVVLPGGTASSFGSHDFTVAAKTGTAQVYGRQRDEEHTRTNIPKQLRNNHLFIAFAPVDNPQIAIAVVVEHSALADKMAGEVLRYYFQHPIVVAEPTHEK
jgi:penicillin-binding protein 2